ncbi:MAG: tRNA uridine-5-carboxymethylaminomethyl(34) synthesis enzyme MnmG, partial [Clostridia bacterium]|nr:tRNA uridine-5-carboxymethylaminomethyl(34) synthesis enzyme MnmG [Clostridia bacterium]
MKEFLLGSYDAVVVGAGHAGCEAALAIARTGLKCALLTLNLDSIAFMACNPSIGGTAKGHLVREIDALGGEMGINADATALQIKMLNVGKGAAVQSLRCQSDKNAYHARMKSVLENTPNLRIIQGEVAEISVKDGAVTGVKTTYGGIIECRAAILATGVYLNAQTITGEVIADSGPNGFSPATRLTENLISLGFNVRRFKTGTPARLDFRSLDLSKLTAQYGEDNVGPFSFMNDAPAPNKAPCYLGYTNLTTHGIILDNLDRSPLYNGTISSTGPRYCPSIETKVVRFSDKERHQIFIEPEGADTLEAYVQGMSTSLPHDIQIEMYRSVEGMENADVMRFAYAIEYDCIDTLDVYPTLEFKKVSGLYTAGQINGTSGYEEAAAQGLMAGLNASLKLRGLPPLVLGRDEAYIGVLIDDLVTKGTEEPYRMMTSRAEFRLSLRQDNADERLTQLGYDCGLVTQERYAKYLERKQIKERTLALLNERAEQKKACVL